MTIAAFPHHYSVQLAGDTVAAGPRPAVAIGAPPEFGGTDGVWSPEHLLVAATVACLKTTFDAIARHKHLAVRDWHAEGVAALDRGPAGPEVTGIDITVAFECDDPSLGRTVLAAAERACLVSRALIAPVRVHATFIQRAA